MAGVIVTIGFSSKFPGSVPELWSVQPPERSATGVFSSGRCNQVCAIARL